MTWPDAVNGVFESLGALMMIWNCRRLYKDKQVRGVSVFAAAVFASWSFWNLYYYPSLHQILSFFGASVMALANASWVIMAIYYTKKNRLTIKC